MFARLFAVATLAAFAVAQECTTGTVTCCNSVLPASQAHGLLEQLGLAHLLTDLTGNVGGDCSSGGLVSVLSGGGSCTQEPICCNENHFGGLIAVGCSPINIHL